MERKIDANHKATIHDIGRPDYGYLHVITIYTQPEYYLVELPLEGIEHCYVNLPLTERIVPLLNAELCCTDLKDDIEEIAYPIDPAEL